uniref:Homeobox domain-containing protein n=1 Tax=Globisporangium ultimum (strain ATCC 200006 / CBS 805.95 / DAOM BR144) TaxID=431595 RepID=K3WFP1_GLOUD
MNSPRAHATAEGDMLASPLLTGTRAVPVTSPTMSKLPGLHLAIAQRRTQDLRLPSFALPFDNAHDNKPSLHLSSHFAPAAFCPETSPTDKTPLQLAVSAMDDDDAKRRKKGTRRGTLNPEAKNVLKAWMFSPEHFAHPYPSEEEKEELASEAGIEVKQLSNWFTNARKRLWQPVLRQSGVEVKNFLSTGRGGPRGNKLDVPANLQHLVSPSPPSSPERLSHTSSPLKRTWSDMEASLPSADESSSSCGSGVANEPHEATVPKRKKLSTSARKKAHKDAAANEDDARATIAHKLSHELRLALAERVAMTTTSSKSSSSSPTNVARFQESEILAATSLLGLYQQYQPVH